MPRDFGPKPPPGWPADRPWPPTSKADVSYLSLLGRDITRTSQGLAHAIKAVPGLAKEFYDYAQAHPIRAGLELAVPPVALGEMAGEVYKKGREGKIDLPNVGMLAMAGIAHVPVLSKLPKFRSAAIKLADGRVFEGALHFNAVEDAMSALRNGRPFKSGAERVRAVDKALAGDSFIALDPKQIKRYDNPGLTQQRADLFRSLQQEHPDWSVRKLADEIKARERSVPKVLGDSAITKGVPAVRNLLTSFQRPDAINLPRVSAVDNTRQFTEDFKKKGGVVADSAASLISRKSTTPHTTGWLDGYTHVEYDTPHGPIKVLYKNLDTDGNLSIESIDTPALDAGANTRGPTVVRAVANDLQQSTGASTVSGNRISGMAPDRQVRRALRPDSLWNLLGSPRE